MLKYVLAVIAAALVLSGCDGSSVVSTARAQIPGDPLSWTAPTERTDGTALAAAEIKEYRIQWGTNAAGPFSVGQQVVPGTATSVTIPRTGYGQRCYVAVTIDVNGIESVPSNPVCKTILAPPRPPVLSVN